MHRATPMNSSFRGYSAGGARSAVDTITDTTLMQEMAGNFMHGETRQGVESPQNYGFTSVVMPAIKDALGNITSSAEAVISFMGGNRSFPVAGVMDDRRHRLIGLQPGDTAMFRTAQDMLQMHLSTDGMFMTGPRNKTVRMQLLDEDSGQQQQQQQGAQPGQHDAGGAGGASGASGQGGQQQKGQKPRYKDGQKSYRFHDVTKDETRSSGTKVRHYLADGKCYFDVNSDTNVYVGYAKEKGKFDKVVTLSGPAINVFGLLVKQS
jgi:phage gp45-like